MVGDKAILPDGFSTILDNVDLRSGSPRPFKAPEYQFSVTGATTRSWEYRGRWFHSDNWQDHVGQYIGSIERVYTTEEGKYPTKTINGVTTLLGTMIPQAPLAVAKSSALTPNNFLATVDYSGKGNLSDGIRYYRIAATTADGIMPPTAYITATIAASALNTSLHALTGSALVNAVLAAGLPTGSTTALGSSVSLSWGKIPNATGYIVFEGDGNEQYHLITLPPTQTSYIDTGTVTAAGDYASQYNQSQSFTYLYTYLRNVQGVQDEGGVSTLSAPIAGSSGRLLTRDMVNDGYFSQTDSSGVALALVATATSATSATTISLSGAITSYNYSTLMTTINKTNHGFFNGEKGYLTGFVDSAWTGNADIIYIDNNNFAIANQSLPSDAILPTSPILTGGFVNGKTYQIATVGDTNWITVGAATAATGVYFTALNAGNGTTGSAYLRGNSYTLPTAASIQPVKTIVTNTYQTVASSALIGRMYVIASAGTTDFTAMGAANSTVGTTFTVTATGSGTGLVTPMVLNGGVDFQTVSAGSLVTGTTYVIATPGSTTWTSVGAPNGLAGTIFNATATAAGTGFANVYTTSAEMVHLADAAGTNTGTYGATYLTPTTFSIPLRTTATATYTELKWLQNNNYYYRWNIYRNEQGIWNLVDSVTLDKLTYEDAKPYAALGGTPNSYYDENGLTVSYSTPPLGLTCIEAHYGMLFGIIGNQVRWTPILAPDAWPESFSVTLSYKPVALASYAQGLIILCEDAVYRLDGNTATGMSLSKTYTEDGCFAPHSVQKTDKGLLYLSKRGIMIFDGAKAECLTDTRITGDTLTNPTSLSVAYPFWWMPTIMTKNYADLAGESSILGTQYAFTLDNTKVIEGYNQYIKSFYHLGKYYLFYTGPNYAANTAVVVDLQLPGLPITTLGMKALDAHVDEFHNAYVLFDNAPPLTTVIITSPA